MFPKPVTKLFHEFDHQRHNVDGVEPLFDLCVRCVEKCVNVKA